MQQHIDFSVEIPVLKQAWQFEEPPLFKIDFLNDENTMKA